MSLYVLDTDTLSLLQRGNASVLDHVLSVPATDVAATVISLEEQISGWYTLVRKAKSDAQVAAAYRSLAGTVRFFGGLSILLYAEPAIARYRDLRRLHPNIAGMDLRIAAIALEYGATVVTRNLRDFAQIPGLSTANWAD